LSLERFHFLGCRQQRHHCIISLDSEVLESRASLVRVWTLRTPQAEGQAPPEFFQVHNRMTTTWMDQPSVPLEGYNCVKGTMGTVFQKYLWNIFGPRTTRVLHTICLVRKEDQGMRQRCIPLSCSSRLLRRGIGAGIFKGAIAVTRNRCCPGQAVAMAALRVLHAMKWRTSRALPLVQITSQRMLRHKTTTTESLTRASPESSRGLQSVNAVAMASHATEAQPREKGIRVRLDLQSEQLIDDHRAALKEVLDAVRGVPEALERDVRLVQSEITRLGDGVFMLVVAGEYNAGKSSLINALLGRDILAEGPTPTTSELTKLKYAEHHMEPQQDEHGVVVLGEPVQVLASRLQVVDTPGTNAIDRSHEALTREFLPLCDIVLFVTSADRPFSESERLFLESIRTWG